MIYYAFTYSHRMYALAKIGTKIYKSIQLYMYMHYLFVDGFTHHLHRQRLLLGSQGNATRNHGDGSLLLPGWGFQGWVDG